MSRIALVDDDRNILTSVAMTLETEGFAVETFNDGQSALEALTARPPEEKKEVKEARERYRELPREKKEKLREKWEKMPRKEKEKYKLEREQRGRK